MAFTFCNLCLPSSSQNYHLHCKILSCKYNVKVWTSRQYNVEWESTRETVITLLNSSSRELPFLPLTSFTSPYVEHTSNLNDTNCDKG